tara:strand:- start:1600 stop:3036 length:1437 start_codon:yes stop_codon:yes gene_type:complete
MISEFNKNRFYNKSNLIVYSLADKYSLTDFNFYYNFISDTIQSDVNVLNLNTKNIYLSLYDYNEYKKYDFIGIFNNEYDHHTIYEYLKATTIYIHKSNLYIAINDRILPLMTSDVNNIIESYNQHFNTKFSIENLNNKPYTMSINAIYPIKIFEKLCGWLSVSDINLHYQLVIFNAFVELVNIEYLDIREPIRHYDHIPFLSYLYLSDIFEKDIETEYIENITSYNSLKTIKYNDITVEQRYCKERYSVYINGVSYYNNLDCYDPIPFMYNDKLYIIFNGLSHRVNKHRVMYISDLTTLKELSVPSEANVIEKNWVPVVKNGLLYFIKSFNPLVIYDYSNNIFINKNISYPYYPKTNLIKYKDYYVGLCYHKEYKKNIKYVGTFVFFMNSDFDIIYISKQLQFLYEETSNPIIKCFNHNDMLCTLNNIIVNVNSTFYKNKLVSSIIPMFIYEKNNDIYVIVNIQHCLSFVYKLNIKPF